MEGRLDIPPVVWSYPLDKIILVWGDYALNTLIHSAQKLLPSAAANNRLSIAREFQILVFRKSEKIIQKQMYGGEPVLCYNVLSSIFPTKNVIASILNRYKEMRTFPTIWALNPHIECASRSGIQVNMVKEGTADAALHMEALFGREKMDEWINIIHQTNTLKKNVEF